MNSEQMPLGVCRLVLALTCVLLCGCHGGHHHRGRDKTSEKPSPAAIPATAKLVASGSGAFDFHVLQDGELYIVNASKKKDFLYSGPFAAGQVIRFDPPAARIQIDGRNIEAPAFRPTDHIEIYEDTTPDNQP
jgi:hypothetical protein